MTRELTPKLKFKYRFMRLMADLGENAAKDPETIWLIGSLAGSIIEDAGKSSWTELKLSQDKEAQNRLLAAFQSQGTQLAKDNNHRAAYAVETLAISVIAPTMATDEHINEGNKLLDKMISDAIDYYHAHPATTKSGL
ncbi:MAG TPA: hypothetical protein ENJ55_02715 [Rhizobiales bacterium]|nr:hypothetical protein [Hyphomicrobiales bacterium]